MFGTLKAMLRVSRKGRPYELYALWFQSFKCLGKCLHELSQSHQPNVTLACVPATPYLLTYLSGQSTKLTELCLYTLGNLCPDSDVVRDKLLAQGIIPALKNCMESQRSNLAVVEAVGFTLSQLLQAKDAAEKTTPAVLASGLPSLLRSVLSPDPQFGLAPAIECAWCLHYLTCSTVGSSALRADGTLSRCSSLLVALGGAVSKGTKEEGMELGGDLLPALCALARAFLPSHPALARESAWVLNNLTADSSELCTALLDLNLVPELIQLLPFSQGINTMLLRVLGNVAHQTKRSCSQLARAGLVPALCATLRMSEPDVVALSLEVLFMLVAGCPQAAEEFVGQNGVALLEAVQYNGDGEIRQRAAHLLEHHLEHHLPAHLLTPPGAPPTSTPPGAPPPSTPPVAPPPQHTSWSTTSQHTTWSTTYPPWSTTYQHTSCSTTSQHTSCSTTSQHTSWSTTSQHTTCSTTYPRSTPPGAPPPSTPPVAPPPSTPPGAPPPSTPPGAPPPSTPPGAPPPPPAHLLEHHLPPQHTSCSTTSQDTSWSTTHPSLAGGGPTLAGGAPSLPDSRVRKLKREKINGFRRENRAKNNIQAVLEELKDKNLINEELKDQA
ncbi:unnamed protein product [Arctogadus glacialis]